MVHGYHVVFGTYGFWLPNDLRGSWSDFIGAWELRKHGGTTKGIERPVLTDQQQRWQKHTKDNLIYPEVVLDGQQALAVGRGVARAIEKSRFQIWACSILPQHIHLVLSRHTFKVEYMVGLLKGEATKALNASSLHPLTGYTNRAGETPTPWNVKSFHGFLESEREIEDAIRYVVENPLKEGKQQQHWKFVTPFAGLDGGYTAYV